MKHNDLTPLPRWRQRQRAVVAWWRRSRDRRKKAYQGLGNAARNTATIAISMAGAILVAYAAWLVYPPAGYAVGGALLWAIQWNYGDKEGQG